MKAMTRTKAVGGSIMVTIPKEIVREEGINVGELIEIEVSKPKKKPNYFGMLKGIGPFKKEYKLDSHD